MDPRRSIRRLVSRPAYAGRPPVRTERIEYPPVNFAAHPSFLSSVSDLSSSRSAGRRVGLALEHDALSLSFSFSRAARARATATASDPASERVAHSERDRECKSEQQGCRELYRADERSLARASSDPSLARAHSSTCRMRSAGSSLPAMRHCFNHTMLTIPLCALSCGGTFAASSSRKTWS